MNLHKERFPHFCKCENVSCSVMAGAKLLFATSWTVAHQAPLHGILQGRILEWVAIHFFKGSFQPRNQTLVSCLADRFFTNWVKESLFTLNIPFNCQVKIQVQPSLGICGGLMPRPPLHPYQKPGIFEALLEHGVIYILPSDSANSAICRVPHLRFWNCGFRNCRFDQSPTTLILRIPQLQIRPTADPQIPGSIAFSKFYTMVHCLRKSKLLCILKINCVFLQDNFHSLS